MAHHHAQAHTGNEPEPGYEHRARVEDERAEKDDFLKNHPQSPLPAGERGGFEGLPYYPVDEAYRFEAELEPVERVEIEVPRTGGDTVTHTRWGRFHLDLPEGEVALTAYRTDPDRDELFIAFRDATSGKETYGGGRYLEVQPLGEGRYLVDLNRAYHPFCVYDDAYTCPVPPVVNWLQVPVRAGERLPEDG